MGAKFSSTAKLYQYEARVLDNKGLVTYKGPAGVMKDFRNSTITAPVGSTIVLKIWEYPKGLRRLHAWAPLQAGQTVQPITDITEEYEAEKEAMVPPISKQAFAGWVGDVFVTEGQMRVLEVAKKRIEASKNINVWLRGDSGYGKTSIPRAFAEANGYDFVLVNCALVVDPEEFFGIRGLKDGQTLFEPTHLAKALEAGRAVIVFDEINRAHTHVVNALFSVLDDTRSAYAAGADFSVAGGIAFFFTSNEGTRFVGTNPLDAALRNRMDVALKVIPLSEEIEIILAERCGLEYAQAQKLVARIRGIRKAVDDTEIMVDVSTRSTKKVANLVADGMGLEDAIMDAIVGMVDEEDLRKLVDIVTDTKFVAG